MLGKVVIGTLVFGLASIGPASAQQVEVPREKVAKLVPETKRVSAQPVVEVHPQMIALAEPRKLSIEEMRKAGAVAAQKVKEEDHDIETDSSTSDVPATAPKKQVAT